MVSILTLVLIILELIEYCEAENVPFTTFNHFGEILCTVQKIVAGEVDVKDVALNKT